MSLDMSRYLTLFVGEATEHLEALSQNLIRLERGATAADVDELFRHAHSVKSMAASMGFEATATLAHRAEDLLDVFRASPTRADRAAVDLLLQAADALLSHVKAAAAQQPFSDVSALTQTLGKRLVELGATPAVTRVAEVLKPPLSAPQPSPRRADPVQPSPRPEPPGPAVDAPPRWAVKLKVDPRSNQPGVRGFLAHKRLSLLGNVFDLKPPLDDIKAGRLPDGLICLELETNEPEEALKKTLRTIADVELASLRPIEPHAPAAAPEPKAHGPRTVGQEPQRTVRVQTEMLDQFLDLAGELLLATARVREVGKSLPAAARPGLDESVDRLHGLVKDLHDKVMKARMTPVSVITDRLPRAARDIARRRDRDVDFQVTGGDIELDRSILDELADPLLHLLRNAIDHGLENADERLAAGKSARGAVAVKLRRERDRVILEVIDDGRGLDAAKLRAAALERGLITQDEAAAMGDHAAFLLCCLPGVTTAADVSDISGRGVGMDAVKRAIEGVGGTLDISSTRGKGACFTLSLPLTVAVVNLLLVGVGEEVFGLPLARVTGVVEASGDALSRTQSSRMLAYANALVPVYSLSDLLEVPSGAAPANGHPRPWVVVESDTGRLALGVDTLLGQEEVVLKALQRPLDLVPGLAGVTILGSGRPIFILDVARLVT
jgi:two-component system, chemotaxis family, sensor kinase CheA